MPPAPPVSLVPAAMSDVELLFSYMQHLRQDDPMPQHTCADEVAIVRAAENLISDPSLGRIWLIRSGEQPVGYAALSFFHSLEFAGQCGLLDEFFIDSQYRRRGIGKSALKWICELAASELKIRAVFLEVSVENDAATALYATAGFTPRPYQMMMKYSAPPDLR